MIFFEIQTERSVKVFIGRKFATTLSLPSPSHAVMYTSTTPSPHHRP